MLALAEMLEHEGAQTSVLGDAVRPQPADATRSRFFPSSVDFDQPTRAGERVRAVGRMIHSSEARRGMQRLLAEYPVDIAHLHNIYHQFSPSILRP